MKLALIYAGGTIGCEGKPLEPLAASTFQVRWGHHIGPRLKDVIAVDWQWLEPPLDSTEMTPPDWARLARVILGAREEQAVLLLHGTDSMAWTAAALAFLLTLYHADGTAMARLDMPVVLTGSQRPLFDGDAILAGTDALANIEAAIRACADGTTGIRVAFGGDLLPGARVMKMSTSADRAFDHPKGAAPSPALPAAKPAAVSAQLDRLAPHLGARAVLSITPNPNAPGMLAAGLAGSIEALGEKLGAIYLNGYGVGNVPGQAEIAPLLRAARDRGILIVAGSQVPYGDVAPSTYGAGHWLAGCGAVASGDMTTAAAQAKLHVALALGATEGWGCAQMERFFLAPAAGELRG